MNNHADKDRSGLWVVTCVGGLDPAEIPEWETVKIEAVTLAKVKRCARELALLAEASGIGLALADRDARNRIICEATRQGNQVCRTFKINLNPRSPSLRALTDAMTTAAIRYEEARALRRRRLEALRRAEGYYRGVKAALDLVAETPNTGTPLALKNLRKQLRAKLRGARKRYTASDLDVLDRMRAWTTARSKFVEAKRQGVRP